MDEKTVVVASSVPIDPEDGTSSPDSDNAAPKNTHMVKIFPWFGLTVLILSVLSVVGSLGVLKAVKNKETKHWPSIDPHTCLSIIASVTNVLVHLALAEGITIAWWYRASRPKTTLEDLHDYWAFGTSIRSAAFAGRKINKVAIATIFVGFMTFNGPLLQQTISTRTKLDTSKISNMTVWVAEGFPSQHTAMITGRNYQPSVLQPNFAPVMVAQSRSDVIPQENTHCDGFCSTRIRAVGFNVTCTPSQTPYNFTYEILDDGSAFALPITVFNTSFLYSTAQPTAMNLTVAFKSTKNNACAGHITNYDCHLRAAVMEQPVLIDSNSSQIMLDNTTSWRDDHTVSFIDPPSDTFELWDGTYGGVWLVMKNRFDSWMNFQFAFAADWETTTYGETALEYIKAELGRSPNCTTTFEDPLDDLLDYVRQLMFRAAIDIANPTKPHAEWVNETDAGGNTSPRRVLLPGNATWTENKHTQKVAATQTRLIVYYHVDYLFWGLSLLVTLLSSLLVVPTYYGFWTLSRRTTLSPVETAAAFKAPVISDAAVDKEVPGLLKEIGKKKIHEDLNFAHIKR